MGDPFVYTAVTVHFKCCVLILRLGGACVYIKYKYYYVSMSVSVYTVFPAYC